MKGVNEDTPTPARMAPCLAGLRRPATSVTAARASGQTGRQGLAAAGRSGREMPAPLGLRAPTCDAEGASVRLPVRSRRRFPTPEPDRDTQAGVRVIPGSVRPPGPGATAPSGRPPLEEPWATVPPRRARGGWVLQCPRATRGQRRPDAAPSFRSSEPGWPPPDASEEGTGRWAPASRTLLQPGGPSGLCPSCFWKVR